MKKMISLFVGICFIQVAAFTQTNPLIERVTKKLNTVNDYVATGVMKTDVAFIKASLGKVKVYFKKPNLLKVKKEGGISLLPKGGVSVTINSLLNNKQYIAIESGVQMFKGKSCKKWMSIKS